MASMLIGYALYYDRHQNSGLRQTPLKPDFDRVRRLLGLGLPAALQLSLEVGVWATAALAGRLGPVSAASHPIALVTVSFTYMVPLGISSAVAVGVGPALGRGDAGGAGTPDSHGWRAQVAENQHPVAKGVNESPGRR